MQLANSAAEGGPRQQKTADRDTVLGQQIRRLLAEQHVKVAELHRFVGGSERHLHDIVNGKVGHPSRETAAKIAAKLGVPVEVLYGVRPTTEVLATEVTLDDMDALRAVAMIERRSEEQVAESALHQWLSERVHAEPAVRAILDGVKQARMDRAATSVESAVESP